LEKYIPGTPEHLNTVLGGKKMEEKESYKTIGKGKKLSMPSERAILEGKPRVSSPLRKSLPIAKKEGLTLMGLSRDLDG
jgi:hypothetical protein